MGSVDVEDHAGIRLARPGKETFAVSLDQADGTVYEVDGMLAKILAHTCKESSKRRARHVYLCDNLAGAGLVGRVFVDQAVVVIQISAELVRIGPVYLSLSGQVVAFVFFKGSALVVVRQIHQATPI